MNLQKLIVLVGLFCFSVVVAQNTSKLTYNKNQAVQDYIGLLSSSEKENLNRKLSNYADSTSTAIVVVVVDKVEDDINYRAAELLTQWGVGQKQKDNGVLMLLSYNDRKVAISTGYGIEDKLTDILSWEIIQNKMIPYFKNGQYYKGIDAGVSSIIQVLNGSFKSDNKGDSSGKGESFFLFLLILIVVMFIIFTDKGGKGRGRRSFAQDILIGSMLNGFFRGGSSSSSGGFGGFGGGRGGGGGASGSW